MRISTGTVTTRQPTLDFPIRRKLLLGTMLTAMLTLTGRAMYLQVFDKEFLQDKGDLQHIGIVDVPAYRGQIKDRNGEPLAISTPVQSIWMNMRQLKDGDQDKLKQMAKILGIADKDLQAFLKKEAGKRFVYVKRQINPDLAEKVKALEITGVYFERAFKRYYPAGATAGHLLGFTNIDDIGQEGMEHGYDYILRGKPGKKRVIKDGKGHIIKDVENIQEAIPGQDLVLTIDERIQYLAYRELQAAVLKHKAHSASLVVLDAKNGDVLASVSQPAFNPNNRKELRSDRYRNRAMVDSFEPGSTVKPFVVAAALDGGYVEPNALIETHGVYHVGRNVVKDIHNYGTLDLTLVLQKSSNIAVTKLAMSMPPEYFWSIYSNLGFGSSAGVGFPGEASGSLLDYQGWHEFDQAILSFGYGVSTSILQLARAYTALADNGVVHSVSLLKRDEDPDSRQIFKPATAQKVRDMLEHVITKEGTAYQARVEGYRVAGKTGTVKKASASGGYTHDKYLSVFVGMAPASNPRFVIAVVVDEPTTGQYYGGLVAAPAFSRVMAGILRIYGVEPDGMDTMPLLLTRQ
ncbi:peptidoglycan D,D-transpeptidase FtsI family protein [Methylomonas methanica]|uniref:Peptidoglycan D,D-transpeptidase FtsI n=1 Tax=Methylomonas methanica (strain DSM 25384 / MC09) TaxID=857087 RepID=F9ZZQ5_METMM|nr:penicillin-binding protein 2 [Methylomonas methanica]AEF98714.1 Peptidoglycan glycosyltransferase [Methylomonas methanica MC09]